MDYSQNWPGFSISNTNHLPTAISNQLCFLSPNHGDSSLLTGSRPKLEDFLREYTVGQFPVTTPASVSNIYDSELQQTLAATFPHCGSVSNEQTNNTSNTQLVQHVPKKTIDSIAHRTSIYRGVTRHRWTGRYEAHLWDNSCRREGQSRKGRQVYLGGYDKEEKAAIAYDLAALKYWGPSTTTNFSISNYEKELVEMKNMNRQEFVASLRRKSSGFSRGASIYRGVTRHHQHGRWQARIGRVAGNKDLYLGTFSTQEEAAEAYDIAAIKFRGLNAVTNFDMNRYDVKSIANSNLPIGGITSGKSKTSSPTKNIASRSDYPDLSSPISMQKAATTSNLSLALPYFSVAPSLVQSTNNGYAGFHNATDPTLMDFSTSSTVNDQVSHDFFNGGFIQQHHNSINNGALSSSTVPFETPIEDYSAYSSWVPTISSLTSDLKTSI